MHAVHNNTVVSGMHAVCDSSAGLTAGLTGGYCRRACRFPALQFSTSVEVSLLVFSWLVGSPLTIFLENRSKDFFHIMHTCSLP